MPSAGRPDPTVAIASLLLWLSHVPAEYMNWMLDTCGSVAVLVSLRTTSPVAASATYKSTDSSPRDDRKAIHFPSGLIVGPTFIPVLCSVPLMTGRPAPDGGVVAARIRS